MKIEVETVVEMCVTHHHCVKTTIKDGILTVWQPFGETDELEIAAQYASGQWAFWTNEVDDDPEPDQVEEGPIESRSGRAISRVSVMVPQADDDLND